MSDNVLALIAIFAVPASFAFSAVIIIRAFRQGIKDGVDKFTGYNRYSELPRLLPPCPHGFTTDEICPTCQHFQKVRGQQ